MTLQELIETLEKADQDLVCANAFSNPHSYRGYYDQLAFEPAINVKVSDMLACAKEALGKTFVGYKGGNYTMKPYTFCWLSRHGETGIALCSTVLKEILRKPSAEADPKPTKQQLNLEELKTKVAELRKDVNDLKIMASDLESQAIDLKSQASDISSVIQDIEYLINKAEKESK